MSRGFCYSGPDNSQDVWRSYRVSAETFLTASGVLVDSIFSDCGSISHIAQPEFVFYYALAHGSSSKFLCEPNQQCTAKQIATYLEPRGRMGFAFLGHCHGMVETGEGSFSHIFRKGRESGSVTIGYYKAEQSEGWRFSLQWQQRLFSYLGQALSFGDAFDEAVADYPEIEEMVRLVGDRELTLEAAKVVREKEEEQKEETPGCRMIAFLTRIFRYLFHS